jgi:hypothetical protein
VDLGGMATVRASGAHSLCTCVGSSCAMFLHQQFLMHSCYYVTGFSPNVSCLYLTNESHTLLVIRTILLPRDTD